MSASVAFLRVFCSFFLQPLSTELSAAALYVLTCLLYVALIWRRRRAAVFVVNYGCFKPPVYWRCPKASYMEHCALLGKFDSASIRFQERILARSGMGERTALPVALHAIPPRISMQAEREECERVLFGAMDELLAMAGVRPQEIGVVVANCSVLGLTPSMASIVVNRYKLPADVKSFNLAGMGCAAGLLALDLAKRVLLAHPDRYAVVLTTENLTRNIYYGNQRSMLVTNCLFRSGASAVLLSNKGRDRKASKYRLLHTFRSHLGSYEPCYRSVYQEEDRAGVVGVALSKDLMQSAGLALKHNLKMLAPRILPLSELFRYVCESFRRKLAAADPKSKPYIPNFKLAFDNVCIHAGGKAVVRAMEQALDLPSQASEPSHMTLYRFGNLSSASVWYELAYEESKGRVKRGNRVWQIGLGSGFKCCSSYMTALRDLDIGSCSQCWADCIADMPVVLPADDDTSAH